MLLYTIPQTITTGYNTESLYIISFVSILFGISTIISKNPILSVLFLICLFTSISFYLVIVGLVFIGISYILVYIGAISILFLFILMLINVRISELLTDNKNSIPLAITTVLSFNFSVQGILPYCLYVFSLVSGYKLLTYKLSDLMNFTQKTDSSYVEQSNYDLRYITESYEIASVKSKTWDAILTEISHISSIGNILYTNLSILLIVTSLILLLAMVGTIVITINKPKLPINTLKDNNFIQLKLFATKELKNLFTINSTNNSTHEVTFDKTIDIFAKLSLKSIILLIVVCVFFFALSVGFKFTILEAYAEDDGSLKDKIAVFFSDAMDELSSKVPYLANENEIKNCFKEAEDVYCVQVYLAVEDELDKIKNNPQFQGLEYLEAETLFEEVDKIKKDDLDTLAEIQQNALDSIRKQ